MNSPKHILLIAGEASGDLHAAHLVKALKQAYPEQYLFTAVGGKHLAAEGVPILYDLAQFGVTGLSAVFKQLHHIQRAFQLIKTHLTQHPPDLLILVDYPGFNLRLAKYAKKKFNLPILYYISPQIWAWKANRIHHIRRYVDHMAVILPFEKALFDKAQIPCTFVGHPLIATMARLPSVIPNPHQIALLPGSRRHEIQTHMPILIQAARHLLDQFPTLQFVIPVANTLSSEDFQPYLAPHKLPITLTTTAAMHVVNHSEAVVVASGTAALECALLTKPTCIIYKTSLLTAIVASQVMRIQYLGLCNLIAKRMIVPELIHVDCTPKNIADTIARFLVDPAAKKGIIERLQHLRHTLSQDQAEQPIHELVHQLTRATCHA